MVRSENVIETHAHMHKLIFCQERNGHLARMCVGLRAYSTVYSCGYLPPLKDITTEQMSRIRGKAIPSSTPALYG